MSIGTRAKYLFFSVALALAVLAPLADERPAPHNYVFFNRDRERIREETFLSTRNFEGAQLKYTWRELESKKDHYEFGEIQKDLDFLEGQSKRLFIQLQDTSFDPQIKNVPDYLLKDDGFGGGADLQYETEEGKEHQARPVGWVARRWDPAVQKRFHKLLSTLGREFDGRIEGINLPETSVDFGDTGRRYPRGFTPEVYRDATVTNMRVARAAFPKSVVMQYANFMPGEWLPGDDRGFLKSVFAQCRELGVGVGGPDLLPHKPGQMKHSYPLIREMAGVVPTGIAVQWGNYEHRDPITGRQVTVKDLVEFAQGYLKINYIFWSTQEPYYSKEVLPFLKRVAQGEERRNAEPREQ